MPTDRDQLVASPEGPLICCDPTATPDPLWRSNGRVKSSILPILARAARFRAWEPQSFLRQWVAPMSDEVGHL
jgi:hypothetical protein